MPQIKFAASMSETGGNNYSNSLIKSLTETEIAWATYRLATGTTDQALPLNMATGVDSIHTFFLASDQNISWRQATTDSSIPLEANGVHALGGTGLTQVLLTNNSGYTAVVQFGVGGPATLSSAVGTSPITTGVFNVMAYGASGNGTDDDSAPVAAAYAALPSGGGTILFPAGTYLLDSAGLSITKANVTLLLDPSAIIDLQTNQISISASSSRFSIRGMAGNPLIRYYGTDAAVAVGAITSTYESVLLSNLWIKVYGAASTAVKIVRATDVVLDRVHLTTNVADSTGLYIDGNGQYSGHILLKDLRVNGNLYGIHCTNSGVGATNGPVNSLTMIGGYLSGPSAAAGSVGFLTDCNNLTVKSCGNSLHGVNIEGWETGIEILNDTAYNFSPEVHFESNTTDVHFGAGTTNNKIVAAFGSNAGAVILINDGDVSNTCALPY